MRLGPRAFKVQMTNEPGLVTDSIHCRGLLNCQDHDGGAIGLIPTYEVVNQITVDYRMFYAWHYVRVVLSARPGSQYKQGRFLLANRAAPRETEDAQSLGRDSARRGWGIRSIEGYSRSGLRICTISLVRGPGGFWARWDHQGEQRLKLN